MSTVRMAGLVAAFAALGLASAPAHAGGNIDEWDVTGFEPSPFPREVIGTANGYRWDDRCIPADYRINASLDPIPNGVGEPPVSLAESIEGFELAFATWNEIPTSYIEMRVAGTTSSTVAPGYDFVNEVSFLWPDDLADFVAYSPGTILIADSTLVDGEDLDLDGDADVSGAISTCTDADGDGDIEFPAGDYQAGTILDNDAIFNTLVRFTVDGSDLEGERTYDLVAVAAHELGHGHGLAHSGITQISLQDGTSATMYNSFRDAIDKFAGRTLHSDDIGWSSFLYPEGSDAEGVRALQAGDVPFVEEFSVIRGEVRDAAGQPVIGQVIFAEAADGTVVASSIGGHGRASVSLADFNPYGTPATPLPPELGIIDGEYALPVPKGVYRIGIEPNDGTPEPTLATSVGALGYGYEGADFVEEYWNGPREAGRERRLGQAVSVSALEDREGIDFVLDDNAHLLNVSPFIVGAVVGVGSRGVLLATRIARERILSLDQGRGVLIQAATFGTFPLDTTPVAVYEAAMITTGRVGGDGIASIDVADPLVKQKPFIGQDGDFTPVFVDRSAALGLYATRVLPDTGEDFFLVLAYPPDEYPGFPGISIYGVIAEVVTTGDTQSYYSLDDGLTWSLEPGLEYGFGLVVAPL